MLRLATHKEYCTAKGEGIDESYHNYKLKEVDVHIRTMFRLRLREYLFKLDTMKQYQCANGLCCGDLRRPSRLAFGRLKNPPTPPEIPPTKEIEGCGWGFHKYKLAGFNVHAKILLKRRFQKRGLEITISTHHRCPECYSDKWSMWRQWTIHI